MDSDVSENSCSVSMQDYEVIHNGERYGIPSSKKTPQNKYIMVEIRIWLSSGTNTLTETSSFRLERE